LYGTLIKDEKRKGKIIMGRKISKMCRKNRKKPTKMWKRM
jgi:hypothetical protein